MYEAIGKVLAAMVVALFTYLVPKIKGWLEANTNKATQEALVQIVDSFVKAAEQLYKDSDPDGSIRNSYVKSSLEQIGYEITTEVVALIESSVFRVNGYEDKC